MKIDIVYYWYDHCMLRDDGCEILGINLTTDKINDAILTHDWDRFRLYRFLLDTLDHYSTADEKLLFFPNQVFCYVEDNEEPEINELTEETFMRITGCDYECG